MPFREAASVRRDDERHVRVRGAGQAERFLERELRVRRLGEVVAAQDFGDPHRGVVHDARELVAGAVGIARDREVAERGAVLDVASEHEVVERGNARRGAEAPDREPVRRKRRARFRPRREPVPAAAVVRERAHGLAVRRALGLFDVAPGADARVDESGRPEPVERVAIARPARGLDVWAAWSADVRALVPVESEPVQVLDRARGRAGLHLRVVEVFDAQDERSAARTDREPRKEERTGVSEMQRAGGGGRKPAARGARHGAPRGPLGGTPPRTARNACSPRRRPRRRRTSPSPPESACCPRCAARTRRSGPGP